ncbi:DUF2213 domain-containing protein [Brevundimonas viscosa]|uniref:DUF2213 domain-containing protein n=1 Tax=Brevundimonas viscosa TaxID=871741 RepID=A0A1I6PQC7_9CAUL|nr:DUF2213 domain-containing protein [Brevundimonas viscosa]SFS42396.1 hypothetical protein SAMN05192570_1179 [Brevundimonas viscosa]
MQFTDAAPIAGVRLTRDGYAVAEVRAARTGIQQYAGREVGRPDLAVVNVYRPPESVFAADSLASYGFKPVTINHPAEAVTADSWKKLAVGIVGGDVVRDGGFVKVPLALMDAAAIKAVQDGTREISMGYVCDLAFEDGVTPEGESYQAVQRDIRINHLALVPKGRAGPHCRVGDQGAPETGQDPAPLHHGDRHMTLKTITVDGLPVETTDAGIAAIEKLRGLLSTADAALATAKTTHDAALAAKDAELAKKDAEIADLKAKVIDGAALDALVAERASIVAKARALDAKVVVDGKTNAEIKRAVLGDGAKDKSDAYVDAAFDLKTADLKPADPLRSTIADANTSVAPVASIRDAARLASLN